ncbi:MAG: methionine biosynthesis protein MetW [Burkholderiales bacterium]|jgi:methionine biosynthesis protein MetW|nr:methionine biosynthesis protein MetW [Burkholderiales bacterium]
MSDTVKKASNVTSVVPEVRKDFSLIAQWIKEGARVLDLGCGDGGLLAYLQQSKNVCGYGVEISIDNVKSCIARGVNVLQRDLEGGLADFSDAHFDCVILSQTLQAMHHLEALVEGMLRVGREAIVTFPNFGHWSHRWQIALQGKMPVSSSLPYQWYNTPNIHLCTVKDFDRFLAERRCEVLERVVMAHGKEIMLLPNVFGQLALYRFRYR